MKAHTKILVFLVPVLFSNGVQGQCLNSESNPSNTGGYFDAASGIREYWWTPSLESTFTIDTEDFYYGNSALRVDVSPEDDFTDNLVRMWTKAGDCTLTVTSGQPWNVSTYIKGEIGDQMEFMLIDADNSNADVGSVIHTIKYSGWHYIRLNFRATGATTNGKLRINFQSLGTYRLDNVVLEQETAFEEFYVDDVVTNGNGSMDSPFNSIINATRYNSNYTPGEPIYVKSGTYYNNNWDGDNNGINDNNNAYAALNSSDFLDSNNGSINRPIVIRNYIDESDQHDTPKIVFDGRGGFQLGSNSTPITHIEIAGFEIQGPNDSITYSEAKNNRDTAVNDKINNGITGAQRNYYHGRGIAVWGGSYINIHNNKVWDCPNSGIRVNNSDYVRIFNNEVFDNTYWAYNAESAIVMAQSRNRDSDQTATKVKMRIENNRVYNNINKLPFFNPSYNCASASDTSYGCGGQNEIIDGSGCYITRNSYDVDNLSGSNPNYETDGPFYGTFLFANNVAYNNGMNGVVVHKTDYAKVYNNTVYKNGEVPSDSDSDWGNYGVDWKDALEVSRQKYTGIVVNSSSNVEVYNNISWAKNNDDKAYVKYTANNWSSSNVQWGKNLAGTGTLISTSNISGQDFTQVDPLFVDPTNATLALRDFSLTESSPAIDQGNANYAMASDINNTPKPQGLGDDIGAYEFGTNTWSGATDSDWLTPTNWSRNRLPSASDQIIVPDVTNQPQISNDDGASGHVVLEDITLNSGAELTLNKGASLSLTADLINNGTLTLNSDSDEFSSLIVGGSSSGTITYNRYVNTVGSGEWDLIGSPTEGTSISSFAATNNTPLATGGGSGSNQYAIGYYDNSSDSWTNYTTTTIGSANNFEMGKGYQMATDSGATLAFTGTIANTTQTQAIIDNADRGGRRWNLIANPFPSYLNANIYADASNNFLSANADLIDDQYEAIYGYNADGKGYTIYNNTSSSAIYIAPGQAFFVAAASTNSANVQFTKAMQTRSGSDDFIANRNNNSSSQFLLNLYEDKTVFATTKFYFKNGLGSGLDPGYDAGSFDQNLALMSRLVDSDSGIGMGINAMSQESLYAERIPLVINRSAGQSFRIKLAASTIPSNIALYLEDVKNKTLTSLRTGDFTLSPREDLSGAGRFFLHIGNLPEEGEEPRNSTLSIYSTLDTETIVLDGLSTKNSGEVHLYNALGQNILVQQVTGVQPSQYLSTVGLAPGIYILKLYTENTTHTKKLIVRKK